MDLNDHAGYYIAQEKIIRQMKEWGYDPYNIAIVDVRPSGYWEFVRDEEGRRIYDGTVDFAQRVRMSWDKDWHFNWIVETILKAERGK